MKTTKSIIALLLVMVMCVGLMAGCSAKKPVSETDVSATGEPAAASDLAYILDKGTLVVGITEFEPMDYRNADSEWIGFDADMAKAFAESLGVDVEFQVIEWDNKVMELDGKTIDCVWNGMTLTDEVKSAMECTGGYFKNAQVVVVPADKAADIKSTEDIKDFSFAVESGSAGKKEIEALGYSYTEVQDQATALLEVNSGTADAAVIDYLMALAMIGEGTSYANLSRTISLNGEEYGVGFRKGSDLTAKLTEFFKAAYADGTMTKIAETYKIADMLIAQ